MYGTRLCAGGQAPGAASRIRSWHAPDIGSVPTRYGFPPSTVRREWDALGALPPLPPADGVSVNVDLDGTYWDVNLYHYQVFPQAMAGLYNLSRDDRAPILEWFDSYSPIAGPETLLFLAEYYWGGEDDEVAFCKSMEIPLEQYDGPTKAAVNQRVREMRDYEKRGTVPLPEKVNTLLDAGDFFPSSMPWGVLADVGSLDEQLLQHAMPDISHNPVFEADCEDLEQLHREVVGTINSFTHSLKLLTELQRIA